MVKHKPYFRKTEYSLSPIFTVLGLLFPLEPSTVTTSFLVPLLLRSKQEHVFLLCNHYLIIITTPLLQDQENKRFSPMLYNERIIYGCISFDLALSAMRIKFPSNGV
jgi:hypothetical protein